jgi:adenylate cyclase
MPPTRQLAAIMFADIVGYTAMMQEDEVLALSWRQKLKRKLEDEITAHQGRILEFRGDGAMCSFISTIEGVRAAVALQLYMRSEPSVPLRIGMHTGDVIFEENNIYGDGVNIASRLESFALPGSIFISGKAYDDIKNQKDIQSISLGKFALKNVKEQVEIFAISNPGIKIPEGNALEGKGEKVIEKKGLEKSIAVLPFLNMSNDPDQEYFSDGITEEIVNLLTHIKDLRVAGRTSSFHFKGRDIDLRSVGQKLNVRTLLEGSIRKQNLRLRITAQLINAEDGIQLWSERYDRDLHDIFAIQDEIALAITEELKMTFLEKDKALINDKRTANKEAYDLYLKGRFYLNKRGSGIKKALEYFQEASEIDPEFSLAYSGMADAYSLLSFYGAIPPKEGMPIARQNAEKAIQLNPFNVEAFTTLAFISVYYDWNWAEAKKRFQRVFEINPHYAPAHYWHSYFLSYVEGRFEEGIEEAKKLVVRLEPLVALSHQVLSVTYINAGKFEEALRSARMAIELDASFFPGFRALGISFAGLKRYEEATEALKTCAHVSSRNPIPLVELAWVYSLRGMDPEIEKIYDELIMRSKTEFISGLVLCAAAYFSKKYDQAIEFMEQSFVQRESILPFIRSFPSCSFLKDDPHFQHFVKRMNFPE